MISLQDVTEIEASPEQVFDWLAHFEDNYLAWHPDHVECRHVSGAPLERGTVIYTEEYLHGQIHKLTFEVTDLVPNSRVDYRAGFGKGGAFKVEPKGDRVLFIATLDVGSRAPVLGWLFDTVMRTLFSDRIEALQRHMAEEGENLKRLLEEGTKHL